MKKILIIIVLVFFWTNYLLADEPEYSNSLNENINKHGWEFLSFFNTTTQRSAVEIITLSKNNWILKCSLHYFYEDEWYKNDYGGYDDFYQRCYLP